MQSIILKIDLHRALQKLSAKERLVLFGIYHLNHTEESLSQRLSVSRRRVRNLRNDGLEKLKRQFVPELANQRLFMG